MLQDAQQLLPRGTGALLELRLGAADKAGVGVLAAQVAARVGIPGQRVRLYAADAVFGDRVELAARCTLRTVLEAHAKFIIKTNSSIN